MGEPGGAGPDLTIAVWREREGLGIPPFYLLADPDFVAGRARQLGVDCPIAAAEPRDTHAVFHEALPVVPLKATAAAQPGRADPTNATAVVEAIARAVGDVRSGEAA